MVGLVDFSNFLGLAALCIFQMNQDVCIPETHQHFFAQAVHTTLNSVGDKTHQHCRGYNEETIYPPTNLQGL